MATRAGVGRQRHAAHGVWLRLRRLLAASARVFATEAAMAERLLAGRARVAEVGQRPEPARPIVRLGPEYQPLIVGARQLRVACRRNPVRRRHRWSWHVTADVLRTRRRAQA